MPEPLNAVEWAELAASIDHLSGPDAWDDDQLEPILIPVTHYVPRLMAEVQQLRGESRPWPVAQRMPTVCVGAVPQPWHHQAVAEYAEATGTSIEPNSNIPGSYSAAQVNQAIGWWNERAESEAQ